MQYGQKYLSNIFLFPIVRDDSSSMNQVSWLWHDGSDGLENHEWLDGTDATFHEPEE